MKKILLLLAFSLSALVAVAAEASLTGTWTLNFDIVGNTSEMTLEFKQKGDTLTGTLNGPEMKPTPVKGKVTGNKVTFEYISDYDGNPLTIVSTGTIAADGTIGGTTEVQPMAVEGTFTAKKFVKKETPKK